MLLYVLENNHCRPRRWSQFRSGSHRPDVRAGVQAVSVQSYGGARGLQLLFLQEVIPMITHQLSTWATLLEWCPLERHIHVPDENQDTERRSAVVWYTAGSYDTAALQVNTHPELIACVFAIRFRLCSGWHLLPTMNSEAAVRREAERLKPWLHASWFRSPIMRRHFREQHPECADWTWRRIREYGVPRWPKGKSNASADT